MHYMFYKYIWLEETNFSFFFLWFTNGEPNGLCNGGFGCGGDIREGALECRVEISSFTVYFFCEDNEYKFVLYMNIQYTLDWSGSKTPIMGLALKILL